MVKHELIQQARLAYWKDISKEERSKRMREIAKARQSKLTVAEKRAIALKMVEARRKKAKKVI